MEVAQHRLSATREQLRHIQAEAAVHTADMEMTVAELQESLEVAQYRLSATEKALQKALETCTSEMEVLLSIVSKRDDAHSQELHFSREELRHIQAEAAVRMADMEMTVAEVQKSLEAMEGELLQSRWEASVLGNVAAQQRQEAEVAMEALESHVTRALQRLWAKEAELENSVALQQQTEAELAKSSALQRQVLEILLRYFDVPSHKQTESGGSLLVHKEALLGKGTYGEVYTADLCQGDEPVRQYAVKLAMVRDP